MTNIGKMLGILQGKYSAAGEKYKYLTWKDNDLTIWYDIDCDDKTSPYSPKLCSLTTIELKAGRLKDVMWELELSLEGEDSFKLSLES